MAVGTEQVASCDSRVQPANAFILPASSYAFGLSFNPAVWNKVETGLKCNTGIKGNHIPWALAYTDS